MDILSNFVEKYMNPNILAAASSWGRVLAKMTFRNINLLTYLLKLLEKYLNV